MNHDSGFHEPGNEGDERDEQRRAGRERAKAHRIAARHFAERRADDKRDSRSNRDGGVSRAAKNPKDKAAEQASVKTSFWRQVSKRRVAQCSRKQICGKGNTGENVAAQPAPIVTPQPSESGNPSGEGRGTHCGNFITSALERSLNLQCLFDDALYIVRPTRELLLMDRCC